MKNEKEIVLLKQLILARKTDEIKDILSRLHPADIAEILEEIKDENKKVFFKLLDSEKATEVLEELEPEDRIPYIEAVPEAQVVKILENMSVDEIIDLLQEMPDEKVEKVIAKLPEEYYQELKSLIKLAEDSAGGIMTTDYVYLFHDITVAEAIEVVRKFGREAETIYYLYVVDQEKHLTGVLSLRELIAAPRHKKIGEIMHKKVVSVQVDEDQEEVAKLISKYSLLALPVVDRENHLLGIVTVDDALDILEEETTEDIHKLAGISPEEDILLTTTIWGAVKKRLPWLVVCLLGDLLSGAVIDGYSRVLESVVAVAFFIPVLMATGGNAGTQSLALSVRGLATGEINRKNVIKFLSGETMAGMLVGLSCGVILALIAAVWQKDFYLSFVVGSSMGIALMISAFVGVLIPMVFNWMNVDPAVASGPFITTIIDVTALLIYFALTMKFLGLRTAV
ncbi:magnesium transporter [Thermosediminibacter litoriperuensis]|uniref:Magnesium transporter MgtE n=1 Tax=Thermosediminibacter litoriperuensis TaxID=291989 RepID=A0A5S5AUY8_9FIRM|nr:magnesium transporter [Thermosediminibacter litoriperuensis]TYP56700.1 magnesium transporter [Thermosediminibacter litoriperuensis]